MNPRRSSDRNQWLIAGYALWALGSILFVVSSIAAGDYLNVAASVLFLLGVISALVPMIVEEREP